MRLGGKRLHTGKLPLLPIFLAGLVLGIIIMNLGKSLLLEDTGLMDEYTLYHMKYMTVDGNALFFYCLRERLKNVAFLAVMATTYLGLAVISGMVLWYGAAAGMFLTAVVLRYGMKGILLAVTGVFPQYLFYVPAVIILMVWGEQLCRSIYFKNTQRLEEGGYSRLSRRLLQLGLVIIVVIIGCVLESYVNPSLLAKLLKIF